MYLVSKMYHPGLCLAAVAVVLSVAGDGGTDRVRGLQEVLTWN